MNHVLPRFAAFGSLGIVLGWGGPSWSTPEFWCIWALTLVIDYLARVEGREQGMVQGLELYADLPEHERNELVRTVKAVQAEYQDKP